MLYISVPPLVAFPYKRPPPPPSVVVALKSITPVDEDIMLNVEGVWDESVANDRLVVFEENKTLTPLPKLVPDVNPLLPAVVVCGLNLVPSKNNPWPLVAPVVSISIFVTNNLFAT